MYLQDIPNLNQLDQAVVKAIGFSGTRPRFQTIGLKDARKKELVTG